MRYRCVGFVSMLLLTGCQLVPVKMEKTRDDIETPKVLHVLESLKFNDPERFRTYFANLSPGGKTDD